MHDNLIVKSDHFATWKKFCESRKDLSCNKWKMSQEKYLLQNDNFNCGVFVCYFFSLLINGQQELLNRQIDINCFRSEIKKTIMSY
jgi:hypothetical protein